MDSINKEQVENNYEDLYGAKAVDKIRELVDKSPVCFFCSSIESGKAFDTRPMSVQKVGDDGSLWFLSAVDSTKNEEIAANPAVQLLFKGSDYSDFLSIYGKATLSRDKNIIEELWNPMIKVWFTEGVNDPRITVIQVKPEEGYYWDTKHNQLVGLLKRTLGSITGLTLDDSIEGKIIA